MKRVLFITACVLILTSCQTVQKTSSIKAIDIYGAGVIHWPVVVDLDVQETKTTALITVKATKTFEAVKDLAIAEALKNTKADVLVEPRFVIERKGGRITAMVTGFPAFYKNFRSISTGDLPLLERGEVKEATIITQSPVRKKRWMK